MSDTLQSLETGEIFENVTRIVTETQEKKISNYVQLQNRRKRLRDTIRYNCGEFYFYRYDKLLEQLNDDTGTAFHFLYLCACADDEGYFIKYGKEYCTTIKDFTYIFDKGQDTVKKYMTSLTLNNLIYKDEKGYKLNPLYYSMGGMDDEFKRKSIRTFNQAIKELYYRSNPKEHSLIGQFIKLVPYINIYNNTLCTNIECTVKEQLDPLTKTDIVNILQPDNTYGYEILDMLMNITIKDEPVIGLFTSLGQYQYRINPKLFYRGNNAKDLQDLIDTFDVAKALYLKKQNKRRMERN